MLMHSDLLSPLALTIAEYPPHEFISCSNPSPTTLSYKSFKERIKDVLPLPFMPSNKLTPSFNSTYVSPANEKKFFMITRFSIIHEFACNFIAFWAEYKMFSIFV